MSAVADASVRRRMSKKERRKQLLDVAADVVIDGGHRNLTMERLAELAGVSKALVYNHFDSIDGVFTALYQRESVRLAWSIWNALESADPDDDLVEVHVRAYFDGVIRSGNIFAALTTPGSTVADRSDPSGEGPRFSSRVLERFHGVDKDRARVLGSIVNAAVLGAGNALRLKTARRAELESAAIHLIRGVVSWKGAS